MAVISCQTCGTVVDDAWSVCPACGADPRLSPATVDAGDAGAADEVVERRPPKPTPSTAPSHPHTPRTPGRPPVADQNPDERPPAAAAAAASPSGTSVLHRAARVVLLGVVFAMIIGAGVYAAVEGDARNVVYSVIATMIFAVILLGERSQKRRKAAAAAAAAGAAGGATAGARPDASPRRRSPAKTLGWLIPLLVIIGVVAFSVIPDQQESQNAGEYNRLVDRITTVERQKQVEVDQFDGLLAGDTLAPLVTWDGDQMKLGDPGSDQITGLLPVVSDVRGVLARSAASSAELVTLWRRMARLETTDERETYARQREELESLEGQRVALIDEHFSLLEQSYAQESLGRADRARIERRLSAIATQVAALEARLAELTRASNAYYQEHF